jgi:hypothetical protein
LGPRKRRGSCISDFEIGWTTWYDYHIKEKGSDMNEQDQAWDDYYEERNQAWADYYEAERQHRDELMKLEIGWTE